MSVIDIRKPHTLDHQHAVELADNVAADLAAKFAVDYGWEEDVLYFHRSGVNGQIDVTENEIRIRAQLGLMLFALKPVIEDEIHRYLHQHYG